jgi:LacI family repressor for deo operon, udp, cdd, tsx, nupC, and nupG
MAVTMKDVAARAGVSIKTVSRVVNNQGEVSDETRQRVQRTIEELGYKPNIVARSLITGKTNTIALLVAEIETPFLLRVQRGIEPMAREHNYNVILFSVSDTADEVKGLEVMRQQRVDGVILNSISLQQDNSHILDFCRTGIPLVAVNRYGLDDSVPQIIWDDETASTEAVLHLVRLGHRRIAHIGGPLDRLSSHCRLRGYKRGLEQTGLVCQDRFIIHGDYRYPSGYNGTLSLLEMDPPPTAIFVANDVMAVACLAAVQRSARRVPDDVAIIGVGDEIFSRYTTPTLTTISLPTAEAGRRAAGILLAQINDESLPETRIVLPASLTVRESCGGQPLDAFDPVALFAEEDRRLVTFDPTGVPGHASAYQPIGTLMHD